METPPNKLEEIAATENVVLTQVAGYYRDCLGAMELLKKALAPHRPDEMITDPDILQRAAKCYENFLEELSKSEEKVWKRRVANNIPCTLNYLEDNLRDLIETFLDNNPSTDANAHHEFPADMDRPDFEEQLGIHGMSIKEFRRKEDKRTLDKGRAEVNQSVGQILPK